MPNRSRKGDVRRAARVVAPTRVNRGRSILIERALGPSPITMSSLKSSSAGYRVSSTTRFRRCTSSMKKTSPSPRLVRIAARSPLRSIAGPLVPVTRVPISLAMMLASVVLPRPGGPCRSTWSSASPRWSAALMEISKFFLTWIWPM